MPKKFLIVSIIAAASAAHVTAASSEIAIGEDRRYLLRGNQLRHDWYRLPYVSLTDVVTSATALDITHRASGEETIEITTEQRKQLLTEVRRTIRLLVAPDYETYRIALLEYFIDGVTFSEQGRKYICDRLRSFDPTQEVADLETEELLERFWIIRTGDGRGAQFFKGYVPSETYYLLSAIREVRPWNSYRLFPEDSDSQGKIQEMSSFDFPAEDPEGIAKRGGLLVADVRIMFHTSEQDLAYPIAYRYWWSPERSAWIPWIAATLYIGQGRKSQTVF